MNVNIAVCKDYRRTFANWNTLALRMSSLLAAATCHNFVDRSLFVQYRVSFSVKYAATLKATSVPPITNCIAQDSQPVHSDVERTYQDLTHYLRRFCLLRESLRTETWIITYQFSPERQRGVLRHAFAVDWTESFLRPCIVAGCAMGASYSGKKPCSDELWMYEERITRVASRPGKRKVHTEYSRGVCGR